MWLILIWTNSELTDQEESDLQALISECENAISDAESFTTKLQTNLSTLDGDNMSAIMESDLSIQNLMRTLELAIDDVTRIEIELDKYDSMLSSIDSQMGAMKSQAQFLNFWAFDLVGHLIWENFEKLFEANTHSNIWC